MPELVREAVEFLGYWGIGVLMIVVAPEVVMPLAGFLAGDGLFSPVGVVLAGSLGAVSGLVALYAVARKLGEARVRAVGARYGRFLLSERDFDAVMRGFRARGDALVLFGRLLPTVRSLISIPAGLVRMPFGRYLLLTATGTVAWNAVLVTAAYHLAAHRQRLLVALEAYELAVGLALVTALAVLVLRALRARLLPDYARDDASVPESPPQRSARSKRMS